MSRAGKEGQQLDNAECAGPQRPDETSIALRVGCTAIARWERSNHAGGQWPHAVRAEWCALVLLSYCTWKIVSSRNQRYLHLDAQDASPKYPYVDASVVSISR